MTKERREEILSRDILTVQDVQELTGKPYEGATVLMRNIKRYFNSAFNERGRIATADYLRYFSSSARTENTQVVSMLVQPVVKRREESAERPLFRAKNYR